MLGQTLEGKHRIRARSHCYSLERNVATAIMDDIAYFPEPHDDIEDLG